jgi:hypothetical protein
MYKLQELFDLCKASVTIQHNEHKDLYQSVGSFLEDQRRNIGGNLGIDHMTRHLIIEKDQLITIRAYPLTPIGFYIVYHWDLESAVDEMLNNLKEE